MAKNPKNKGMYIIMLKQSVLDRIEVIAHSGIRIDGEKVIYIDPVLVNGESHAADILLFTHPHTDHSWVFSKISQSSFGLSTRFLFL